MANIVVPIEFFRKERRDMYRQWQFAFWRELFQNSIDAGASQITINFFDEGGNVRIAFNDNGCGMTRDVLENVFFRLGASTKGDDGSSVGGFGRARILTCFSMHSYSIWTGDLRVTGRGSSYEIETVPDNFIKGCWFSVVIDDAPEGGLRDTLDEYLRNSQLACEVFIEGTRYTGWTNRGRLARELQLDDETFAHVYVNKSEKAIRNRMIVRVSGTAMYAKHLSSPAQVIVEIVPAKSRSVLTGSRDGMRSDYSDILDGFFAQLSADLTSAVRPRIQRRSTRVTGDLGLLRVKRPERPEEKRARETVMAAFVQATGRPQTYQQAQRLEPTTYEEQVGQNCFYDVFIEDETDNKAVRKVMRRYEPAHWGSTTRKLLDLWRVACEDAIMALIESGERDSMSFGIGWVFSDEMGAGHKEIGHTHVLLLNPVNADGKLRYSLRDRQHQLRLMALAQHEVAHIMRDWHDERYASVLTEIMARFDQKATLARMKTVLSGS